MRALALALFFTALNVVWAEENSKQTPAEKAPSKTLVQGPLSMSVTGTQDAPNVLYIVPWKTVDAIPKDPYASSLLDEVFSPVDPVEFERSIRIHDQIQSRAKAGNIQSDR